MSNQPQDWTEEDVSRICWSGGYGFTNIADAHNAVLAVKQKHLDDAKETVKARGAEVIRLCQQLAAEREKVKMLADALERIQASHTLNDANDIASDTLAKMKEVK